MVQMGDFVVDEVSGFTGTIISEHRYLNGCTRCTVQPKVGEDGKLPESQTFDEPSLKLLRKEVSEGDHITGGPEKYSDRGPVQDKGR